MKTNKINQTEEQPKEDPYLEVIKKNMIQANDNKINILKIQQYLEMAIPKQTIKESEPATLKQSSKELEAKEKCKMIDRVFIPKKKQWHILKQNDFEDFETEVVNSK